MSECPTCQGFGVINVKSGSVPSFDRKVCPDCKGRGMTSKIKGEYAPIIRLKAPSVHRHLTGRKTVECPTCHGTGTVKV